MQVFIHAGVDKTGSSAIQKHFRLHREFLLERGIYLPETALTNLGHVELFRDLEERTWDALHDELRGAQARKARAVFLSWEGIWFYSANKLKLLSDYLKGWAVTLIFYIRDQKEIIQAGYLQLLKTRKQAVHLTDFSRDDSLLHPPSRDYHARLERFAGVFGKDALLVRVYDRRRFPEHSVVYDLLEAIGLGPEDRFPIAPVDHNISLDVDSARLLNIFDSVCDDSAARRRLVSELLFYLENNGSGSKYFLGPAELSKIEASYAASNLKVKTQFCPSLPGRSLFAQSRSASRSAPDTSGMICELARQVDAPLWNGKRLSGPELRVVVDGNPGWHSCREEGVLSEGACSALRFRTPAGLPNQGWQVLRLHFRGHYALGGSLTELSCSGRVLGELDLSHAWCDIPMSLMEAGRKVELTLQHDALPTQGRTGATRRVRYGQLQLESLRYELR